MPNNKAVLPRRDERIAVFIKLIRQQALRNWQREQSVRSFPCSAGQRGVRVALESSLYADDMLLQR